MDKEMKEIGKAFKLARQSKKLSQKQVAEIAGIRRATVVDIENGNANFTISTLLQMVKAIGSKCKFTIHE